MGEAFAESVLVGAEVGAAAEVTMEGFFWLLGILVVMTRCLWGVRRRKGSAGFPGGYADLGGSRAGRAMVRLG